MTPTERILIFGATGAIGQSVVEAAIARQWHVTAVSRTPHSSTSAGITNLLLDPLAANFDPAQLDTGAPYTSVCWAQGANTNDSIYNVDFDTHLEIYRANCLYILVTLQALLKHKLLAPASRLCVISSVWQNVARQSKLSYSMSKAALQGLVLSATADLGAEGHLINAVLPGALDTPMARKNLTPAQLERMSSATSFGRLPALTDVASLVCYLCSPENTGITGQFIAADLGYSHVRIV
ncbi:SDR family oxidoreductase [Granulicella sp. dw_53]|uniref:SDR family oxidoreductase n=1 Tax=Granulicella sp. dw_53 TaxID=2719792 RepID=UPI001BD24550|nr:SDR family oxidoreductase [Granulicella sp. dw_53]